MKTDSRTTLTLLLEDKQEHDDWHGAIESYAWAEGEFGLICTEVAFRDFCESAETNPQLTSEMRSAARRFAELLQTGRYTDVCLDAGIT